MTYLLTAVCNAWAQDFFELLRIRYFPPERNVVPAHIQLFHQLPEAHAEEIFGLLKELVTESQWCAADVLPPRSIGSGIIFPLSSPDLSALHGKLSARWHDWLIPQDLQAFRPHIVVQNKVDAAKVQATLPAVLGSGYPSNVQVVALRVWRYLNGPWERIEEFMLPSL